MKGLGVLRFERRVDAMNIVEVSDSDLRKRIVCLDAELDTLAADRVHVSSHCSGAEQYRHRISINREYKAALANLARYVTELEKRAL